jgi:hypothetical protein
MKFVVSRGDTNNPEFIGIEIPPSTPGFKHARIFPKGFRFEVTDPKIIQRVREGQFTIEDDGSPKSEAEITKIDAEVSAEIERLKKMADEMKRAERARKAASKNWYEKPVGIITISVIGAVIVLFIAALLAHYWPTWFHS